jgi:hypothetical protein
VIRRCKENRSCGGVSFEGGRLSAGEYGRKTLEDFEGEPATDGERILETETTSARQPRKREKAWTACQRSEETRCPNPRTEAELWRASSEAKTQTTHMRTEKPRRGTAPTTTRHGVTSEERQREGRKILLRGKTLENRRHGSPGGANLCTAHAVTATSSSRERDTHGAPLVERCRNSEPRQHANQRKTSAERCRRKTEAGVPR